MQEEKCILLLRKVFAWFSGVRGWRVGALFNRFATKKISAAIIMSGIFMMTSKKNVNSFMITKLCCQCQSHQGKKC
jgi:hypothetical protein